jgi:hypothetical protein
MPGCRKRSRTEKRRRGQSSASEQTLEAALLGLQPIRRLITICAWCKKIRNSKGGWRQVSPGFHPKAPLSHGICPACAGNEYDAYRGKIALNAARELPRKPQVFPGYETKNYLSAQLSDNQPAG